MNGERAQEPGAACPEAGDTNCRPADGGTGDGRGGGPRPPRIPPQRASSDGGPPGGPGDGDGGVHGNGGGGGRGGAGEGDDGSVGIPAPRDGERDLPGLPQELWAPRDYDHKVLKSLLGAWALAACSPDEAMAVETHLKDCDGCTEEAGRLRRAVGLLHPEDSLDLDPSLRSHVLEGCLVRRPARTPVPSWAAPYEAETARLDALLRDMAKEEWKAPVHLRWFDGTAPAERNTTVAGVISHLFAVDGVLARTLGLPDPLSARPVSGGAAADPTVRTEELWQAEEALPQPVRVRAPWREQSRAMVRTASFENHGAAGLDVSYGTFALPVRDAFIERAFECWVHAGDIAEAIDYPYGPPTGEHLNHMVDLAARLLPGAVAARRQAGLATSQQRLTTAGAPGRTLHLEIEGSGGGHWYISLDSPGAQPSKDDQVAHIALDGTEFCQLAAGHIPPQDAAAGQDGDRDAVRDVLYAAASLSRL